jgi:hypothetical protein
MGGMDMEKLMAMMKAQGGDMPDMGDMAGEL